jgi:hypothetical protein
LATSNTPTKRGRPPKPKEIEGDSLVDAGKEIVKRKPGAGNPALVGDKAMETKPGDNAQYLGQGLEVMNLPPINFSKDQEIEDRINEYFAICAKWDVKPAVSGLSMALGLDRRRLWEIKADVEDRNVNLTQRGRDVIKKAYVFMENLWENYMLNYKIHPTAGIFLAKNNFGYKDEQTYNLVPNNAMGAEGDPTQMAEKYQKALPGAVIEAEGAEEE